MESSDDEPQRESVFLAQRDGLFRVRSYDRRLAPK
jgi:hypothetical protein